METQDKASILAQGIANARKIMEKVEINTGGTRMTQQPEINRAMYADDADDREPVYLSEAEVAARTRTAGGPTSKNTMKNLRRTRFQRVP